MIVMDVDTGKHSSVLLIFRPWKNMEIRVVAFLYIETDFISSDMIWSNGMLKVCGID
jgi:hypothetical protein